MSQLDAAPEPSPEALPTAEPTLAPASAARSRESWLLLAASGFQLAVLATMIAGAALLFWNTRTVYLQVEPIDPRDLFRGEYVILEFPFNRVPIDGVPGLPGPYTSDNYADWHGRAIFVPLIDEGDGKHFHAGPPSLDPPQGGGPFLQGTLKERDRIDFGIDAYFVQEGRGKEYEDAARDHKLWAEVGLTRHGWPTLQGLRVE